MSVVPDPRRPESPAVRLADQRARLQEVAAALAQTVDPRAIAALIVDAACDGLETPQGWVTVVTPDGRPRSVPASQFPSLPRPSASARTRPSPSGSGLRPARRRRRWSRSRSRGGCSLQGEDTYVEQVLRNLLGNAAKYGGSGSTVAIEASATPADVELRVSDEGPGIEEGEAELLFDLFYRSPTVATTHAGGGIGLFVCRQLVRAMGGRIRAERRPDGGARFIVALPRYADDDIG